MKTRLLILKIILVLIWAGVYEISAQTYIPDRYVNPVAQRNYEQTFLTNMAANNIMRSQMLRDSLKAGNKGKGRTAPVTRKLSPTEFVVKGIDIITDEELLILAEGDKTRKDEMDKHLNQIVQNYAKRIRSEYIPAADVAAAITYYLVTNYQIGHNHGKKTPNYDPTLIKDYLNNPYYISEYKKIYEQIAAAMIADGSAAKMTNEQKEKITGTLIFSSGLTLDAYEKASANQDVKIMDALSEAAKVSLENFFGVKFDNIVIKNSGITFKP